MASREEHTLRRPCEAIVIPYGTKSELPQGTVVRVMQRLGGHPRIEVLRPEGAFYAFPRIKGLTDSLAFAQTLVEQENVGVAPGYTFGSGFDGHIRLSFAQSHSRLSSALDGLLHHLDKTD